MVYKEVLVVGKICYSELDPYTNRKQKDSDYKKPQLALLRVCKQIHSEAEPLYLGMNLFVLPNKFKDYRPFVEYGRDSYHWETRRFLFSKAVFTHVRNISFAFTSDQNEKMNYHNKWAEYHSDPWAERYADMPYVVQCNTMHEWRLEDAENNWGDLQLSLCLFQSRMDYVQVDYSDTYCPSGCCRRVGQCTYHWILMFEPKVLNVMGLLEWEESEFSCMDFGGSETVRYEVDALKASYGLHFMQPGEGTKWDAYRVENCGHVEGESEQE
jgi:hypothetical protein